MAILMKNGLAVGDSSTPQYTFETVAAMNSAIQSGAVPADGAEIFVKEDVPMGNTGDTELDTESTNWVQNQAVATEVISLNSHLAKMEVLVVSTGNTVVTSLPYTFNDAAIETDMVCLKAELGTPSSQLSDWTVNTDTAGQAVVSGTIASTGTTIKLYLMKSR